MKVIVAWNYEQAAYYASDELKLSRREAVLLSTSVSTETTAGQLMGLMIDEEDVVFVPGWSQGVEAMELVDLLGWRIVGGWSKMKVVGGGRGWGKS